MLQVYTEQVTILSSDISGARIQDFIFVPTRDYFRADIRIPDNMFRCHEEFCNREPLMSSSLCREQCRTLRFIGFHMLAGSTWRHFYYFFQSGNTSLVVAPHTL